MRAIQPQHCVRMSRLHVTVAVTEGKRQPWIVFHLYHNCMQYNMKRLHQYVNNKRADDGERQINVQSLCFKSRAGSSASFSSSSAKSSQHLRVYLFF